MGNVITFHLGHRIDLIMHAERVHADTLIQRGHYNEVDNCGLKFFAWIAVLLTVVLWFVAIINNRPIIMLTVNTHSQALPFANDDVSLERGRTLS